MAELVDSGLYAALLVLAGLLLGLSLRSFDPQAIGAGRRKAERLGLRLAAGLVLLVAVFPVPAAALCEGPAATPSCTPGWFDVLRFSPARRVLQGEWSWVEAGATCACPATAPAPPAPATSAG